MKQRSLGSLVIKLFYVLSIFLEIMIKLSLLINAFYSVDIFCADFLLAPQLPVVLRRTSETDHYSFFSYTYASSKLIPRRLIPKSTAGINCIKEDDCNKFAEY